MGQEDPDRADQLHVYWGAEDHLRPAGDRRRHRLRLLLTIAAVTIVGGAGQVVMASAATPHPAVSSGAVGQLTSTEVSTPDGPPAPTTTVAPTPEPAATKPAAPATTHVSGPAESEQAAVDSALQTRSQTPASAGLASAGGCGAALSYLAANSAPGFQFECPGYALGHQAMTCVNVSGVCAGEKLIVIADACPAAYMNEAHNSWIVAGLRSGAIDPYGYCH